MNYPLISAEKEIKKELQKILSEHNYDKKINLEKPPEGKGNYAFPCFKLASIFKKSPKSIAEDIANKIKLKDWIEKIEIEGGYINFFLKDEKIFEKTITSILDLKEKYGCLEDKNKKVIVEHTSANPNGPLHIGRARNPIIGDTIYRIYKKAGYNTKSQFYLDDLGKQVAVLAWGNRNIKDIEKKQSNKKSDHKAVTYYQKANKIMEKEDNVKKEINELVKKSEEGDNKTISYIKKSYAPVLDGIKQTLSRINIDIDKYVPESKFVKNKSVFEVLEKLKKSEYCHNEEGAYFIDMKPFGIQGRNTNFFITRKDGTTLYATRDIAYHIWKNKKADLLINILGEDHKLESKQVETALKLMGIKKIPKAIFYSFVSMPGGKMSTRRGRVVYLDDLIDECVKRAYKEIKKRRKDELSKEKMEKIAEEIGTGAVRYNIIKVQPEKDIVFKWDEAINFEGDAAPFIQYSHARTSGILNKYQKTGQFNKIKIKMLKHDSEKKLILKLAEFPLMIKQASKEYKPHITTAYLYKLASLFNQFYRDCPVLSVKNNDLKKARLALVKSTKIVLKNGLNLLGIKAPEEM
ncbi:MAG: arginine--tRNA ligase [Candidatus Thermoplasmatota archaeon]